MSFRLRHFSLCNDSSWKQFSLCNGSLSQEVVNINLEGAFKETYQVVGADRLGRGRHLPGVGRERRRPGRARVIGDVGRVGRVASPSSRPALQLGLGTDAGLGRVVVLLVDVHLHLLFLQNSGQKRSVLVRRRRLQIMRASAMREMKFA